MIIDINEIWKITDGGRTIIEDIYPQSKDSFNGRKNFKIRPDDKKASCSVFKDKTKTFWFFQDKGGGDTKAKNAIVLIQEAKGLDYYNSLKYAWENYCNGTIIFNNTFPEPKIENTKKEYDKIQVKPKKGFTPFELSVLGVGIKEEHCKDFSLVALDYYITKKGYKIKSTDEYPIYYYDYGTFGKIYQPFAKEYRFLYVGEKPDHYIFSDNRTAKLLNKIKKGEFLSTDDENSDKQLEEVIMCTGPSDALTVYTNGYRVVWFNSETGDFTASDYRILKKLAKTIYTLPDIDKTGVKEVLEICTRFLDIHIIWLPEDLKRFKDWKGNQCKDVRDFFKYYHNTTYYNNAFYFKKLVETSLSLQFWVVIIEEDKNGIKHFKYEISNEHIYRFLNACGFFTIDSKATKSEYSYIRIIDNVVEEIPEKKIQEHINKFLIDYLGNHLEYYNIKLINSIHRTNQLKLASLAKLKRIELDFKSYGVGFDYLFFKNCAILITGQKIEKFSINTTSKYVMKDKIIDFHFIPSESPFSIEFTQEYRELLESLDRSNLPQEKEIIRTKIDGVRDVDRFELIIKDNSYSLIRYLINTSNVHWQKQEKGISLTLDEIKENNLHFINKVIALGYCLYRYKEAGRAYATYAMETSQGMLGAHRGGTGKSFFFSLIKYVRKLVEESGQKADLVTDKHLFSKVIKGDTEFAYFDDVAERHDLHIFMPAVTGAMEVEPKFVNKYTIDYEESPKIGISSNHPVRNMDPSLKRRLWFVGFSDYYHPEERSTGTKERTMLTEFGKNLIKDFTNDEMSKYYNLMCWCLNFYLKFHEKVNPPMDDIEKRNLQGLLGDEFIDWARDYFTVEKLNIDLNKENAFTDYKERFTEKDRRFLKATKFKQRLKLYAEYCGYIFNPQDLMCSQTEIQRNDIRKHVDGKDVYCFHYRTNDFKTTPEQPKKDYEVVINNQKIPF
ncbi:MAG: toprim domain-containing protein [Bacteroidales bacterium]|nr:toprim domain-containing protein [Bacteroidales bacterium]